MLGLGGLRALGREGLSRVFSGIRGLGLLKVLGFNGLQDFTVAGVFGLQV